MAFEATPCSSDTGANLLTIQVNKATGTISTRQIDLIYLRLAQEYVNR